LNDDKEKTRHDAERRQDFSLGKVDEAGKCTCASVALHNVTIRPPLQFKLVYHHCSFEEGNDRTVQDERVTDMFMIFNLCVLCILFVWAEPRRIYKLLTPMQVNMKSRTLVEARRCKNKKVDFYQVSYSL